jgi:parvulin-like peptidyl-prolyl isomerase
MRITRKLSALGAFFVLAIALAGCGSGIPGDSVAVMAGNPITTQAFDHWMYVAAKGNASQSPGAPVIVPNDPPEFTGCIKQVRAQIPTLAKTSNKTIKQDCNQLFQSLSGQVMDFLIKAYWYQATASKLHINLTNAQVQKAFQTEKKQEFPTSTAFTSFLKQTGQTMQDILFRVRVNEIYKKLLARNTTKITPASIQSYYNSHTSQFGTPATRNIRIVRTKTQSAAQAALSALKSGQSWTAVSKKYSIDTATKNSGGLLTDVTNGEEEAALNKVAFSAPLNKLQGPVHGQFGWYVVEVVKITPATHQSLAKATPLIKELLGSQTQQNASQAVDKKAKKEWGAKTLCRPAYSMADCHGYKPPKTTTTATPTPAPSTTTAPTSTGTATSGKGTSTTSGNKKKK